MIGVIAHPTDHDVIREFFELFKTPWEFCATNRQYDVLLCAGGVQAGVAAKVVIFYAGVHTQFDHEQNFRISRQRKCPCYFSHQEFRIPIYGESVALAEKENGLLYDKDSHECVASLEQSKDCVIARIGCDLFGEIRTLLTVGQPPANANIPALELHITFLRNLITSCGVSLTEIPPVPEGYRFIVCLTHDVDHPSVRRHKWDHTILGFMYRAVFGSLWRFVTRQIAFRNLYINLAAVMKLPFVYMGFAKDFWREFDERYMALESGVSSTFFVIPFKNHPGKTTRGSAPRFRAARYAARDIEDTIQKLLLGGCEVGLHGIDAWIDSSNGLKELEELHSLTGISETGVRMHWLYYDQESPATLEKAGAVYDSSIGYNETVGYRAGTLQVYKPLNTNRLLELPMHVMDTALFYPNYLRLSSRDAKAVIKKMVDDAVQFGGCLTVNWHDRSVVPERLWDDFYGDLVQDLKSRGAWFATAGQAVSWFKKRRSAMFEIDSETGQARAKITSEHANRIPGLRLRAHDAPRFCANGIVPSEQSDVGTADESIDGDFSSASAK